MPKNAVVFGHPKIKGKPNAEAATWAIFGDVEQAVDLNNIFNHSDGSVNEQ